MILKHFKFHQEFYRIKYFNKELKILIKKSKIINNFFIYKKRLHNFLWFFKFIVILFFILYMLFFLYFKDA